MSQLSPQSIATLLIHYRFDFGSSQVKTVVVFWLQTYNFQWIIWAIVEAIYQQRYKSISVDRMLALWLQRGRPHYHFSSDYERAILQVLNSQDDDLDGDPLPNRTVDRDVFIPPPPQLEFDRPILGQKLDPDVTLPARFHRHESPEGAEFEPNQISEESPSLTSTQVIIPQSCSALDDDPNWSNLPRSSEEIALDGDDVSDFFYRIVSIAGDDLQ